MPRLAALLAFLLPLAGCYGVPEDTRVQVLRAQAWGGALPGCLELAVDLDASRMAAGACEAVDPTNGTALPFESVEALRSGIDDSEIGAMDMPPDPGCPTCPTRAYRVLVVSESANTSRELHIVPAAALVQTLTTLGAP